MGYKIVIFLTRRWNPKAKLWASGHQQLMHHIRLAMNNRTSADVLWMHCASLGEFEQGRPVLENIKRRFPATCLVLTFFSPSGYESAKNDTGADHIFYLPMDAAANAATFLDIVKPALVIWVKYEYWYYYLAEIKKRNIPSLLVSANFFKGQLFFKWYGGFYRNILTCFSHLFVQTEASAKMLAAIGFTQNISISGDTRFDRVTDIASRFEPIALIERFCGDSQVIVAGSTWEADEEVLDHYANTHPEIKFIIAPHEIGHTHIHDIQKLFHRSVVYSALAAALPATGEPIAARQQANVLIIDNIGMLSRLYKYATISYVGGGFGEEGVHNVLEAAVYGKPVVFGPVYNKFVEAEELVENGGGFSIENALEAEEIFKILLRSTHEYTKACDASRNYVFSKKGAKDMITGYIVQHKLLRNR